MIARVRGTRDIIDTRMFNFAVEQITRILKLHNYQQIITPVLEPLELFCRSLGTETDVVSKEMFIVQSSSAQDDDTKNSICLRPEMTASIARTFVDENIQTVPWKVFSIGQCFRYERPQKGRYREFYQCSIEHIGTASVAQDAQMIAVLDYLFGQQFKLVNYAVHVNFLGTPEERASFKETLSVFLNEHAERLCATCLKRKETNILRVFDCKNESCKAVYRNAPLLTDSLQENSQKEWKALQDFLGALSVSFIHNPFLVRGLDYYNKTVFEFVSDDLGAQSTFCGGGRYDKLIGEISGKTDQPSIGAAIGIDRLLMLLENVKNQLPVLYDQRLSVIIPVASEQHTLGLLLTDALIRAGKTVEMLSDGSLKSMMRKADRMGAKYVLIVGEQEMQDGTVLIKDMQAGKETVVKQIDATKFL